MTAQATELAAIAVQWAQPPADMIGKLPRVTCADCSKRDRTCTKHSKAKCAGCGAYISTAHIHLDYLGHAETTLALIQSDPLWSWEPLAWTDEGLPLYTVRKSTATMWGRLTVHGKAMLGVGSCGADKDDLEKELIGDFLRNAAMRFGIALSLWSKSEWEDAHVDPPIVEPPITPAQKGEIQAALDALNVIVKADVGGWWKDQGFPSLKSGTLTERQAAAILRRLEDSVPMPGVEQPTTPEGSEAGEEDSSAVDLVDTSIDGSVPSSEGAAPSAAARAALARTKEK